MANEPAKDIGFIYFLVRGVINKIKKQLDRMLVYDFILIRHD